MNITFFDVETNEYKLLGTKSKNLVTALKVLEISLFKEFFKQLKEEGKIKTDDMDDE